MSGLVISCIAVGGAGILFALLAIPFLTHEKRLTKKCSATIMGTVIDYKRSYTSSETAIAPLVEFYIDGVQYTAYRHYKGVVSAKKASSKDTAEQSAFGFYVSENDWFHRRQTGTVASLVAEAREVWPMGSELPVVYNPEKPKQAFVEKVVVKTKVAGIVLLFLGAAMAVIAGLIFVLHG